MTISVFEDLKTRLNKEFTPIKNKFDYGIHKMPKFCENYLITPFSMHHNATIGLFCANASVYASWKIFPENFMIKNFTSQSLISRGNFTSMFSHQSALHLYLNMFCLGSFSHALMGIDISNYKNTKYYTDKSRNMSNEKFLSIYVLSGLIGSIASSLVIKQHYGLGASGAIMGLFSYNILNNPDDKYNILGIPYDISGKNIMIAMLGIHIPLAYLMTQKRVILNIDWMCHLGGMVGGSLCYFFDN